MKYNALFLTPVILYGMNLDVQHGNDHVIIDIHEALQMPATPRLSPLFHHDPIERVSAQHNLTPANQADRVTQIKKTLSNNKLMIFSNVITALIGATVTLIVHFTAN